MPGGYTDFGYVYAGVEYATVDEAEAARQSDEDSS